MNTANRTYYRNMKNYWSQRGWGYEFKHLSPAKRQIARNRSRFYEALYAQTF